MFLLFINLDTAILLAYTKIIIVTGILCIASVSIMLLINYTTEWTVKAIYHLIINVRKKN